MTESLQLDPEQIQHMEHVIREATAIEKLPQQERAKAKLPAPRVIIDVYRAILDDAWMNIVDHGKPRTGKTTLQMDIAFAVYDDWDLVLQSFIYNLSGLLYKMNHGIPCRIYTWNLLHNRVPLLMPDDWGAHGNKAKTQHEPAMDIFKGAIDTYGTKFAVLLSSMGTPNSLTQQLTEKYTHELYVPERGVAKYDKVDWQQNFSGWQVRTDKAWQDTFTFDEVPTDVYREYDENRLNLVDELNQLITDAMIDNDAIKLLKRMEPIEKDFLETVNHQGTISRAWLGKPENEKYREVLKKCKARSLVIAVKKAGTEQYCYDLTDLGFEIVKLNQAASGPSSIEEKIKRATEHDSRTPIS